MLKNQALSSKNKTPKCICNAWHHIFLCGGTSPYFVSLFLFKLSQVRTLLIICTSASTLAQISGTVFVTELSLVLFVSVV